MAEFFRVITADQFIGLLGRFPRLAAERVPLDASLGRILAADMASPEDLPQGARSTVDGYAVRAEDTFGASDAIPALLEVAASVPMGVLPDFAIQSGQAAQISTGGFLPRGADAVVMVEYTNAAGSRSVEVTRPVTVKANVLERGEDARAGELLLAAGRTLRPQELGFLAALGVCAVEVGRRPRVSVISSGDEVVPMDREPSPGQIRDANSHSIAAMVRACGAEPVPFGIVPDSADRLRDALADALSQADVVAVSGGSSIGTRDLIVDTVTSLPATEILAHGVSIRPGKPTLLAMRQGKAIFGLPGHPVSALIVAEVFLAPFLQYLQGASLEKGPLGPQVRAVLATSVPSTIGLEEFVRVRLEQTEEGVKAARPVFGKSGMLSTMVTADGVLRIPMNSEGFSKGEMVPVTLI